jgi:peptidyl-dipeptidase A
MTRPYTRLASAIAVALSLAVLTSGCERKASAPAAQKETGDAFVERLNREISERGHELSVAGFAYATFINQDTEYLNAKANERFLEYFSSAVEQAKAHEGEQLSPGSARTPGGGCGVGPGTSRNGHEGLCYSYLNRARRAWTS